MPHETQLRAVNHRGPDSSGWFLHGPAAVGQARLSIIDLVAGDPPITNEDGDIGVALNGEIYNYLELRSELEARGHSFSTACDTEVIAHLAEERHGEELACALDGMFAIALWDGRRDRLTLIRDRVGKKPIYYWTDGKRLVFGSEIKSLLVHPDVPRRLNPGAIPAYLTFGYVPTPETFYEGIFSLPPGHVLILDSGRPPCIKSYWSPPCLGIDSTGLDLTAAEAANHVRLLLRRAVKRRLMADVPLGAFLSGGIDSSAVVGLMSELMDRPVKTFTIGFDDVEGFDERVFARRISQRFRTEHHEFVVRPQAVDLVERLVWHHDQPFGDSSAVPTFLLSELTRQHVTVALSGDGGDELFAGYERFAAALVLREYQRIPVPLRRLAFHGLERLPSEAVNGRVGSLQRFVQRADLPLPGAYLAWLSYVDPDWHRALLGHNDDRGINGYRGLWARTDGAQYIDRLLDLNFRTYLLDDLLVKTDRMSMAHALEVRSPFLDRELVEFAARVPGRLKVRGPRLKWILKRAVGDLLPPDLLNRRKRGFGVPVARWFREDLMGYFDARIMAPKARVRDHLVGEQINALVAEHRAGVRDHGHALWALLTLEVFLQREGW